MVTNILPTDLSPPPSRSWGFGQTVKIHFFSEHSNVAYQMASRMQLLGSKYFASRSDPGVGSKSIFSEYGHAAYEIKWSHKCSNMQAHILSLHTPRFLGWGQRS